MDGLEEDDRSLTPLVPAEPLLSSRGQRQYMDHAADVIRWWWHMKMVDGGLGSPHERAKASRMRLWFYESRRRDRRCA